MEVQALQGYFVDDVFYQQGQRAKIPNHKMVIINVLDMAIDNEESETTNKENVERRLAQLKDINALIDLSADEAFPFMHRDTTCANLSTYSTRGNLYMRCYIKNGLQ